MHYLLLVESEKPQESVIANMLQPYHEYECTGVKDQYVVFTPVEETTLNWLKKYYEEHEEEYDSFDNFIACEGFERDQDGVILRETNPNSQWDWWVIGGRWDKHLPLENGKATNQAQVKDIDMTKLDDFLPFAYLDDDGFDIKEWGASDDTGAYDRFREKILALPPDSYLTVVDCHC